MKAAHEIDSRLLAAWTLAVCVFIVTPFVAVVAVSLTPNDYISLPADGVSLKWYVRLLDEPVYLEAGWNSLVLAAASAATALVLGVLPAIAVVRHRFPMRDAIQLVMTSPLFVPMVMTGLAILVFFAAMGWGSQAGRLYIGHCALTVPYVFRAACASLAGFDVNQELAARNLGASAPRAFLLVTVPQLLPGLMAGAVFAFVVSFDNVGLSIFLSGAEVRTLPVELLAHVENDNDPLSASLSVAMLAISFGAVLLTERMVGLQRVLRG